MPTKQYIITAYKDDSGVYSRAGNQVAISCNHKKEALFGITMTGEFVPLPMSTIPMGTVGSNDFESGSAMIPPGTVTIDPTEFTGPYRWQVYQVKDMDTLRTYWVDASEYAAAVVACNPVPYVTACAIVTGLDDGTPGQTTATISFTPTPGSVGSEYINKTSNVAPVIDGTYVDNSAVNNAGVIGVSLTGLSAGTTYYFWIRTICPGLRSSWTSLTYATAP